MHHLLLTSCSSVSHWGVNRRHVHDGRRAGDSNQDRVAVLVDGPLRSWRRRRGWEPGDATSTVTAHVRRWRAVGPRAALLGTPRVDRVTIPDRRTSLAVVLSLEVEQVQA